LHYLLKSFQNIFGQNHRRSSMASWDLYLLTAFCAIKIAVDALKKLRIDTLNRQALANQS
jgi:hypothetical protein